ncbi:MAG: DUF2283 domain-containing protein [Pseudomonadota bacterium]
MQFDYDATTDSLYISLNGETSTESEELSGGLILDYNSAGEIVGMDIQHASDYSEDMKKVSRFVDNSANECDL